MKCPKCNFELKEGSKFCSVCGNKIENVCSKCGGQISENDKFCSNCGANLQELNTEIKDIKNNNDSVDMGNEADIDKYEIEKGLLHGTSIKRKAYVENTEVNDFNMNGKKTKRLNNKFIKITLLVLVIIILIIIFSKILGSIGKWNTFWHPIDQTFKYIFLFIIIYVILEIIKKIFKK